MISREAVAERSAEQNHVTLRFFTQITRRQSRRFRSAVGASSTVAFKVFDQHRFNHAAMLEKSSLRQTQLRLRRAGKLGQRVPKIMIGKLFLGYLN